MNINQLAEDIHANAIQHGFWDGERNTGEAIALIHSELSEALEEHRAGRPLVYGTDRHWTIEYPNIGYIDGMMIHTETGDPIKPEGTAIELVDVLIRTLDLLAGLGVTDIEMLVKAKMIYNASRPRLHGKNY